MCGIWRGIDPGPVARTSRLHRPSDFLPATPGRLPAGGKRARALLAALFFSSALHAELPAPIAQSLHQAGIPQSQVGLVVHDLDDDRPLAGHNEDKAFNPASVMKLLTTLAALDQLGPARTFKTRVLLDGRLEAGVLHGNLILQGGGDPALTLERYWLLLREVREAGVREIRGDVLLDNSHYALEPETSFADATPLRPYNAPVAALLVNFNTVNLRLGAEPRLEPADPALPGLDIPPAAADMGCNGLKDRLSLSNGRLTLAGGYPVAWGESSLALNLLTPDATAAAWFRLLWRELGGGLSGVARAGVASESAVVLREFDSPPLSQLVRDANKYSNNVTAKMLFLNLGVARFGAPATWDKAQRAMREWLAEKDLECGQLALENGSGLSRLERVTPRFIARLLRWATRQPLWFEFAASLPAAGVEGTVKSRLAASNVRGQAWLKSGSLKDARNLAGYVRTREGKRRVLVLLLNHESLNLAGRVQDTAVEWTADLLESSRANIGTPAN